MSLKNQEHIIFFIGILVISVFMGIGITSVSVNVPLITAGCLILFFIGFFKPSWAFVLLIMGMLLSPEFSVAKVPRRDVVIRIEDFLIIVFTFAWLARIAILKRQKIIVHTPLNKPILLYSVIFTIITLRGMLLGYVKELSGTFYILKFFEYFLIYFYVCNVFRDKKQAKIYIGTFLFTFLIVNIYAASQIGTFGRISAPFEGEGEPNTLGGYIVLLQGIILGITIHIASARKRIMLTGLFLFSLLTLMYTFSRSSYAAFIPMYLTIILLHKTKKKNILIAAMIMAIVLSIFFFPQNVKDRLAYTFIPQVQETIDPVAIGSVTLGPSASARIRSWIHFFEIWKRRPFLGFGLTGLGFIDSQYVRVLAELGLLGLTAFLALLISIYRHTLRIYRNTRNDLLKGLALGFLAGHVGMVVHALTANTYIIIRIMEPYWFLAAMVMMIPNIDDPKPEPDPVSHDNIEDYPRAAKFFLTSNQFRISTQIKS